MEKQELGLKVRPLLRSMEVGDVAEVSMKNVDLHSLRSNVSSLKKTDGLWYEITSKKSELKILIRRVK